MTFDLRLPIGLLFSLFGILLICYGFITPASLYKVSFDINVNLRWGCALLGFGAFMLTLAVRSRRAEGGL